MAFELVNHTSRIPFNWYKLGTGKQEVKYLEMSVIIFRENSSNIQEPSE